MSALSIPVRPWRRLPADLASALGSRFESTVEAVALGVNEVPGFARTGEAKFERDVHLAVRSALEHFLDLVGSDAPALPTSVHETFVALGAAEARDERSPEVLLTALRTAGRGLLRAAASALDSDRETSSEELLDLADAVTAYVDALVAAATDGYARQLREQAGETDRRRRVLGELLLRGDVAAAAALAAAAEAGWADLGTLVPVLLPLAHARDARFRYGADGVVVERTEDAVLLVRAGRRTTRKQLTATWRGRSAVVGPALDWHRMPEGVRLAELTTTLGVADPQSAPVFVDDHLAALCLRGEPGALAILAAQRLAPLNHLPPSTRGRLETTLHSWLLNWGSRPEVARDLFIHPQTVSYRVRQLRELLGDDLDDPVVRSELLLVLTERAVSAGAATRHGHGLPA